MPGTAGWKPAASWLFRGAEIMCLAAPARVVEMDAGSDLALVSLGGIHRKVSLALVEDVEVGDYLLVHVGYALSRIDREKAESTLALMEQARPSGNTGS